ncbi:MAG: ATP-binding protein [Lachnospiraceae bacterium]
MEKSKWNAEREYKELISKISVLTVRINLETNQIIRGESVDKELYHLFATLSAEDILEELASRIPNKNLRERFQQQFNFAQLKTSYQNGKEMLTMEIAACIGSKEKLWMDFIVHLLREPETGEMSAFLYALDKTQEKIMKGVMNTIIQKDYDFIMIIDMTNHRIAPYHFSQKLDFSFTIGKSMPYEKTILNCIHKNVEPRDRERVIQDCDLTVIHNQLSRNGSYKISYLIRTQEGKIRKKQVQFCMMREDYQAVLMTRIDVQDTFEEQERINKELSEALEAAEKASEIKADFLARMSHEIRTPMNAILGLSDIAAQNLENKELVAECIQKSRAASNYLLSLLTDILDMSKFECKKMILENKQIDCEEIIETVTTIIEPQAKLVGVRFILEKELNYRKKYIGDPIHLQQILINLLNNAIKFTKSGGKVKLFVSEKEQSDQKIALQFRVSDTGIGIHKNFLPKLFEPFEQEHNETTSQYSGRGLGLSIAKNLVELMNGTITVDSYVGVGTTFTVDVQLDKEPAQGEKIISIQSGSETELNYAGKRLLLVEDHPLNTMVARAMLEGKKIEVVHAENGKLALDLFTNNCENFFDLILMDIRMPIMDGLTATKCIRELQRSDAKTIPIVAMTANAYDDDRERTRLAGMNEHIAKPIEPDYLFKVLHKFLA